MRKRHLLGSILSMIPFRIARGFRLLHRGEYLTVLCYHRVLDKPDDFPFDEDLISASVSQFAYQLSFISKHFNVINFKMLKDHLEKSGRMPHNALIITFDDGYIDNYEVAFPLLKSHGLTATMFVTAGFIDRKRMFWWDKIAYIVKNAGVDSIELREPIDVSLKLDDPADRQEAARFVIKRAKSLKDEDKELLISGLSGLLGVRIMEDGYRMTMTWEQLREMSRNGIEIGSHSVNHPIFSNIDENSLKSEVSQAGEIIERELGEEVITFGAPGRGVLTPEDRKRFESLLRKTVEESGYSFSTMYRWGLVYENEFDPFGIWRLGIETHDSNTSFRAKLSFPEIMIY